MKTFLVSLIFTLALLLEDPFSELYSVAPDRELSSQVKKEANKLIAVSPHVAKHFHITNKQIECKVTKSMFEPLAYSENRLDGRLSSIFLADEVGALPTTYPIEAMRSSQVTLPNGLGFVISTAYPSLDNPMIAEVKTAKDVLDGLMPEDEGRTFSLIYEPDDPEAWNTEEAILQANPLCYSVKTLLDELKVNMSRAERIPSTKANFLTKHLNIFVDGQLAGEYINIDDLRLCETGSFNWQGKEVFLGVDLSLTTDNTAVTMIHYDKLEQKYYAKSWAFLPNHDIDIKSKKENLNYYDLEAEGLCFIQGDRVIDYHFVEEFVLNIQDEYGVTIKGIGYDLYNAASSVSKWINAGIPCIEVPQRSGVLHGATKLLKEEVLNQNFQYESNILYEKNFSNARETRDTNLNMYINKKKSTGKIDMVAATINAMHLWKEDKLSGNHIYEERGLVIL